MAGKTGCQSTSFPGSTSSRPGVFVANPLAVPANRQRLQTARYEFAMPARRFAVGGRVIAGFPLLCRRRRIGRFAARSKRVNWFSLGLAVAGTAGVVWPVRAVFLWLHGRM